MDLTRGRILELPSGAGRLPWPAEVFAAAFQCRAAEVRGGMLTPSDHGAHGATEYGNPLFESVLERPLPVRQRHFNRRPVLIF